MFRLVIVAGKGRGLVASRAIVAGTIIERAPAVRLPASDRELIERSALFPYIFADPAGFGSGRHDILVAFGHVTFCNHAEQPTATVRWEEDEVGLWASLEAVRDLVPGEEISLFYTNISEYSAADLFI